jgi:hypothetical protein
MVLGPVVHNQPGLPNALNIENFHQYNKHFSGFENFETEFQTNQVTGYTDSNPHRHKQFYNRLPAIQTARGNTPTFSVWRDINDGRVYHLQGPTGYVKSRQFYCNFYERLAKTTESFAQLKQYLLQGYKLQICGADAYTFTDCDVAYNDAFRSWGHENCLFVMLTEQDEAKLPWRKFKTFDF